MNCPNCGKDAGILKNTCPHCGYPLKLSSQLGTSIPQEVKPEAEKPSAVKPSVEGDEESIGKVIAPATGPTTPASTKKVNARKLVLTIVIADLIITAFIVYFLVFYQSSKNPESTPGKNLTTENSTTLHDEEVKKMQDYNEHRWHTTESTLPGNPLKMIVNTDSLILHSNMGEQYSPVIEQPRLFKGDRITLILQKGDWAQVRTEKGYTGWIIMKKDGTDLLITDLLIKGDSK